MARKQSFDGAVLHFNAVRYRVTGSGNLQGQLASLDNIRQDQLAPLAMQATTDTEPTLLANFIQQKAQVYGYTQAIDEVFTITTIVVFVKQLWTSYPQ